MQGFLYIADLLGVFVFAISGALAGARRQMDIFGIGVVALLPAVGGGTLRDLILDARPVFWIADPTPIYVALAAAVLTFFISDRFQSRLTVLIWADAFGMALFSIAGAAKAMTFDVPSIVAVMMGVTTAVAGGIIREVITNEVSLLQRPEIYATAATAGSLTYVLMVEAGAPRPLCAIIGFLAAFGLRALALRYNWSLPQARARRD